jgi:A/G-specific adenine glycosylase
MHYSAITTFQRVVWGYFVAHGRHDLPWRIPNSDNSFDPYKILVSEIMLQQTQVARVWPKYEMFVRKFPTIQKLAAAPLGDVLITWQGLGYNRRAKYLWHAAQKVMQDFGGQFPQTQAELVTLPGVGVNTAGAVVAYAYNAPAVFVETNIRTVFIHHFFRDQTNVSDKEVLEFVRQTLPKDKSREWFWALMDYGVHLKQSVGNVSRASKSYTKQSKFAGSKRQIRGHVLRLLSNHPYTLQELSATIADERLASVLQTLEHEGLLRHQSKTYSLF